MIAKIRKSIAILLVSGVAGIAGAYFYSSLQNQGQTISSKNSFFNQPVRFASLSGEETGSQVDLTKAAEISIHAVVHVKTTFNSRSTYNPFDPFGMWEQPRNQTPQRSSGSGVIITEDGYIVTTTMW